MTASFEFATKFHFRWVRVSILAAPLLAIIVLAQPAQAQNLVPDPYFTNGLPDNGSTDQAGNGFVYMGTTATTPMTFDGKTGIVLSGAQAGFFEISLAGYDNNSVNYVFTFLAAAVDPQTQTGVNAQFGTTVPTVGCDGGPCANVVQQLTSSGLTQFTLTGTSAFSSDGTIGGYLFLGAAGSGDVFITGLDFEPAPAPLPGGGLLSFCAAIASGLGVRRLRRRKTA